MKIAAETIPTDCTARLKSRPSAADSPSASTSTGNPTVPPPIGVDPAKYDPAAIAAAIGQWSATTDQSDPRATIASQEP